MIAKRKTLTVLLAAMPFAVSAQNRVAGVTERLIVEEALCTFEDYEVNGVITGNDVKEEFLNLFVSKDAPVFNDLMGIATGSELKAEEYAKLQQEKIQSFDVKFANVRKERVYNENGMWKIDLSADKSLTYFNNCELFFSTKDWYGTSYRETFTMVYAPADNGRRCRIEKITGTIDSSRTFPEHFYILNRTSDRDNKLMYVNADSQRFPLKFNAYDQVVINDKIEPENFYYPNADTKLIPISDPDCHTMTMSYKSERWRLKLHYDQPFGYYTASTDVKPLTSKSSAMEVGIDIGYNAYASTKFKFGIYTGVGISSSKLDLTLDTLNYAVETHGDADVDGDDYTRHYECMTGSESIKTSHLVVPLYFDGEIRLHDRVAAVLQLGIRNYLKISQSSSKFSLAADKVYGYYPQYDMMLDHHWGFNNFGQGTQWNHSTNTVDFSTYGLDVFANAGFRVKLIPRLYADVLVGYQTAVVGGIDNSMETEQMVSYACSGLTGIDRVNSLAHGLNSLNRSHVKLSLALVWKF